ncbi:MAG: hypothetical protein O2913_09930 [Chloroflexi bacterium]|nr:hypothetical protein [Chloroflexota bacterium]
MHIPAGSMFRAAKLLADGNGELSTSEFKSRAKLTDKSFYNVTRDMRLLGLAKVEDDKVVLQIGIMSEGDDFEEHFRGHSRERLRRNRLVARILDALEIEGFLPLNGVANLLADSCPYISASEETWLIYSRVFSEWIDASDLATYNKKEANIYKFSPGTEIRERNLLLGKSRGGIAVPTIQYEPIEDAGIRLINALDGTKVIDWTGMTRSTRTKSLAALEDLKFIVRKRRSLTVLGRLRNFVNQTERRPSLFAERALEIDSFATFVEILRKYESTGRTLRQLGAELNEELKADWKESTAEVNAKVMLNWARHSGLAPKAFETRWRPNHLSESDQISLFQSNES